MLSAPHWLDWRSVQSCSKGSIKKPKRVGGFQIWWEVLEQIAKSRRETLAADVTKQGGGNLSPDVKINYQRLLFS